MTPDSSSLSPIPNQPDSATGNGAVDLSPAEHSLWQAVKNALQEVGDFGEVRLIVRKSRPRFLEIVRSQPLVDSQFKD